jgi:predicted phosphodiesterase
MIQHHRNSHQHNINGKGIKLLLMSDIHWDNPHCDRETLKKHLEYAQKIGAKVLINGDFFCFMQGKYDPRRAKSEIRPEHNVANYIDAVIADAVDWWKPYADTLIFIGYGNHETSITKNLETDPLQRFADLFNYTHKPQDPISIGGYGGWITFQFTRAGSNRRSYAIHYFHGSGGGGPVTKGTIQHQRQMADTEGADCIWMGHVHELYTMYQSKKMLNGNRVPVTREVLHVRTGTYKEEHGDGFMGWHVERGAPPKPIGCVKLEINYVRERNPKELHYITAVPTIMSNTFAG